MDPIVEILEKKASREYTGQLLFHINDACIKHDHYWVKKDFGIINHLSWRYYIEKTLPNLK